jgi:PAS domain S-box-containing protein
MDLNSAVEASAPRSGERQQADSASTAEFRTNTKGTLLVVDDAPVNLKLLVGALTAEGYDVLSAEDGEAALASVAAHVPELVLLDICMPGLDGFEVCRRLRAQVASRDIPVMFISATGESAERVEGLRLGAVDFVTKPFHREELLARVQTHLELRRLRVRLEQQAEGLRQVNAQLQSELTERKRIEDKLRQLSRAVEQSPASIVITNPAGDIEYANPKFIELTGYALEEVLGKNPRILKSGDKPQETYRELWQAITAGKEWHGEFHNRKKDGELYWESASISPIRDPAGRITHYLAVKEDITARKQTEAERDRLIRDLQSALAKVKSLSGLLPICAGCKKIRDDKGYWSQVESYVQKHSEARFSHGMCPDCIKKWYPELEQAGLTDPKG